jgi:hypothetical protein
MAVKPSRWIRRAVDAAKWVDKHLLTWGSWKLRPKVAYLNEKKEDNPGHFPRKGKE